MPHLVFVPAYNCAAQIGRVLAKFAGLPDGVVDRVLVIDNRSSDDTLAAACRAVDGLAVETHVVRNLQNYGLGGSQKVGFAHALAHGFDRVTILHGDDQGSIADLLPALSVDRAPDAGALLGARFMRGSRLDGYSAFRTFGNRVYNGLFSLVVGRRLFDLGSGLNSYRTRIFGDGFHLRFPDDLTFNYCMVLAHVHLRHDPAFFPIHWREDDQVSNVRLFRQATRVLQLLGGYARDRDGFLAAEHRAAPRADYPSETVHCNR